jgi:hypothetical protein
VRSIDHAQVSFAMALATNMPGVRQSPPVYYSLLLLAIYISDNIRVNGMEVSMHHLSFVLNTKA